MLLMYRSQPAHHHC